MAIGFQVGLLRNPFSSQCVACNVGITTTKYLSAIGYRIPLAIRSPSLPIADCR